MYIARGHKLRGDKDAERQDRERGETEWRGIGKQTQGIGTEGRNRGEEARERDRGRYKGERQNTKFRRG